MTWVKQTYSETSAEGVNSYSLTTGGGWVGNVFTGAGEQNDYAYVGINLQTDEAGTLTFEFSQDGTNWSAYPVTQFTISPNINEVHTAWKGGRYVRPKFTGTGGRTYFRLQVYYSNHPLPLSAPLNQSINTDQDATIVRSVNIGQDPTGNYVNQVLDGAGFRTTSNLNSGATYDSGVLNMSQYTQVQTHIVCDQDGTLEFIFCSSASATGNTPGVNGVERALTVPYVAANGFQLYSAPCFTPYVRYTFTNNGGVSTTQLFFETKFLTKSLSGQLLGMDAFIAPSMIANLGRNVQVGRDPEGSFVNVRIDGDAAETSTPLGIGGVWTSSLINMSGYSQIETRLFADQEGTLVGRWYSDPNKTQLIRTFIRPYQGAEVGDVSYFSSPTFGDYLEYEYTNGAVAQTGFNLELYQRTKSISGQVLGMNDYIPEGVVANLGRNVLVGQNKAGQFRNMPVDSEGHLFAHIHDPQTAFGQIKTAEETTEIQAQFPYAILPAMVNTTVANGGTVVSQNSMAVLSTSTATNGSAKMSTKAVMKYQPGTGAVSRFTAVFTAGVAGATQVIGYGDDNDGFFIGYNGADFGILRRQNGTPTWTTQTNFNVDKLDGSNSLTNPSAINIDPTKGNVFMIKFQWLGFGAITFYVEDPLSGDFEPFHIIQYANANLIPSIFAPSLPMTVEVTKTSGATDIAISTASMMAALEGRRIINGPTFSHKKVGSTSTPHVFSIRNKATNVYGGTNTNRYSIYLKLLSYANDGISTTTYTIEQNATLAGGTWTDVDANSSLVEFNDTATISVAGTELIPFTAAKGTGDSKDIFDQLIELRPGQTITIRSSNGNSSDVALVWVEDI